MSLDHQLTGLGHSHELAGEDEVRIRGLLHDLGHQMMTVSLLAESVRADAALSEESRRMMELVLQEMFRAMDMITDNIPVDRPGVAGGESGIADVRGVAAEVAKLAELAYETTVTLLPGPAAKIRICPTLLWRVLSNLVDNAVSAAGPAGRVEISVRQDLDTIIEIVDDGPGFGDGPRGLAGLGMSVVEQLLETVGGRLEVARCPAGGTRARIIFGLERAYMMVPAYAGPWH